MSADPSLGLDPAARISDDWRSEPLVFSSKNIETAEDLNATSFYGLCLRQAQTMPLTWKLEEDGQLVTEGSASCAHGNFQVDLTDLENLSCGVTHTLSVRDTALGATARMTLTRRCPAIQSAVESNGCLRERVLGAGDTPSCEYVCYDHGLVVQKELLSLDLCPAGAP